MFPVWVPLRPPVGRFVRPFVLWSALGLPPSVGRFPCFILSATFILCMSSTASAAVLSHTAYTGVVQHGAARAAPLGLAIHTTIGQLASGLACHTRLNKNPLYFYNALSRSRDPGYSGWVSVRVPIYRFREKFVRVSSCSSMD